MRGNECGGVTDRGSSRFEIVSSLRRLPIWKLVLAFGFVSEFSGIPQPRLYADPSISIGTGISRIDGDDLKRHVTTLASDSFEGREAGARGGKAAVAYLRSALKVIREKNGLPQETTQEFGRDYQNLLVFLPGSDETLKREIVIAGAHYDHVGYGKASNSHGPIGQIHNGADDNASGTAALLELIEAFSSLPQRPSRSLLFAFWDAEEAGLLGSKHWVAHPTLPLPDVRFVLNLDMLGRLRDGRTITVGWRSAAGLRQLLASHNSRNELDLAFQPRVIADSDHHPFYAAGIPVIHLDTDKHDDYHRPSDDPDRLNWDGLRQLTEFSYRVLADASTRPELPRFRREALTEPPPNWMSTRSSVSPPLRLGVNWDQDLLRKKIIAISQVNSNSPAAKAGLQSGDRILRFGPWNNGTLEDLKTTIQVVRNPVSLQIERPGKEAPIEVDVHLQGNPIRLGAGWIEDSALPNCVIITHVVAESPADRAGIAAGDILYEMGGRPLASSEELKQRVLSEPSPFQFRIERQGRIRDVTVDLLEDPAPRRVTNKSR